jgi:homoserine trans-succinylase
MDSIASEATIQMWTFWQDGFIMYVSTAKFKFYYNLPKKKRNESRASIWSEKKKHRASVMYYFNSEYLEPMLWTSEFRQQNINT